METEIITEDTLPDGVDVTPADGKPADSGVVEFKDVLSRITGKQFTSNESAEKSAKDTFGYVGKVGKVLPTFTQLQQKFGGEQQAIKKMESLLEDEKPTQTVPDEKFVPREQYETDTFFSKKPELEQFRSVITAAQKAGGYSTLQETIEKDATLKGMIEKSSSYDEIQNSKSVLQTNSRLGAVNDKITQSKQALSEGNDAQARSSAVSAVLDAYPLEK